VTTATQFLPPPLVPLHLHTLHRWGWNKFQLLLWAVVLAYVGMLSMAGLYFVVFETIPSVTAWWHARVPDPETRHMYRDVCEGLLGGLLAQQVIWNHYKSRKTELNWLDRLEIWLHIANVKDNRPLSLKQLLATPVLVIIYALPGYFLGRGIVWLVPHLPFVHGAGTLLRETVRPYAPSVWSKLESTVTADWPKKVIGYGAALFMGRRPAKGVFDDLQLWVAEWFVRNGKSVHRLLPPTFQARYNEVVVRGGAFVAQKQHASRLWLVWIGAGIGTALALVGLFVLMFIA
jgi:hypothetical protein